MVPCSSITDNSYDIIWICCFKLIHKDLHAFCIAVRHDEKKTLSVYWINSTIYIAVFTDVMTRYCGASTVWTPADFWLIDSSKTRFILKEYSHLFLRILGRQNPYVVFNFFEASIASSSAFFGCRALGITLRHPCLLSSI